MTENEAAFDALRLAQDARRAARARPPLPAWFAPARGLLFAAGFALVTGPWNQHNGVLFAGMAIMMAFLGIHAVVVNRGGVVVLPEGPVGGRILRQLVPAVVYGLGWLAAIPFGQAAGAVASAVLCGVALAAVTVWEDRRAAA
ncbi:MAG: hypothetical protein HOY71_16165 [Nonomuraea sp.]|nr:hypothetical protein [Nonomuraea sp.]